MFFTQPLKLNGVHKITVESGIESSYCDRMISQLNKSEGLMPWKK